MKNIFNIFKTDLNNIRKNKAAIVVIVALMILPSMYAWFNIIPSWDPYANTADVSVAVVNLDEGTEVEGEKINVGDNVIDSLRDNKKLGWKFVGKDEALAGVEKGDYYATIIIPDDFSEKLTSVLDDVPKKPILDYYINEKINAIAPKVTGAGASGIVENIQSGFVKVANEAIFTAFNDVGIELEANQKAIERFRDSIYRLEDDLPEIERLLGVADDDLILVQKAIGRANEGLVKAEEISKEAKTMSQKLEETLQKGDQAVQKYIPIVKEDLRLTQKAVQQIPGITDQIAGKSEEIDDVFDKIIDGTAKIEEGNASLDQLIDLLKETDKTLTEDRQLEDLVVQLQKESDKLTELEKNIKKAIENLEKENGLDKEIADKIGDLAEDIGKNNYEDTKEAIESSHGNLDDPEIQEKMIELQKTAKNTADLTENLVDFPQHSEETLEALKDTLKQIEVGQDAIQSLITLSENLQKSFDDGIFLNGVDRVENLQDELKKFNDKILQSVDKGKDTKVIVGETLDYIKKTSTELDLLITDVLLFIDQEFLPKYNDASNKANTALKEGNQTLDKIIDYFPTAYELLEKVDDGVHKGQDGLEKAEEIFPEMKEKIEKLADRIRVLEKQGDLDQVIKLMKNDPSAEGDFFSEPILLNEHELFPIPNYGSAMAPFFTAMSLWVGGLILVSSLIVDVPNKHRYKSYETYFGRILTFWMIGLAQALIVTGGNMFILKTFVAHKFFFILFGFLISTTFIVIVYTLVSVFGNTGKVIAIVLLVMQLGASGGTFPIQMTPTFFQKIHGFLPFTHALGLFREAVGGIMWLVVLKHVLWLVGYMVLFLFIGIKLKAHINKSSDQFLEEARKSEIIL